MKKITEKEMIEKAKELEPYQNKWVALVDDQIVASGDTPKEVQEQAEQNGYTDVVFHLVSSFATTSIFPL
jgi:Family of unknown function (DUF5678)